MYDACKKSTFLRFIRLWWDHHFDMWPNCVDTVCFINCKYWDLRSSIDNQRQEGLICGSYFCTDKSCIQNSSFISDIHLHICLAQKSMSICVISYIVLWKWHILLFNMHSTKHLTDNIVAVSYSGDSIKLVKFCSGGPACFWIFYAVTASRHILLN